MPRQSATTEAMNLWFMTQPTKGGPINIALWIMAQTWLGSLSPKKQSQLVDSGTKSNVYLNY